MTSSAYILEKICCQHGLEISEPQKSRGYSFCVDEYKQYKEKINELSSELGELSDKKVLADSSDINAGKIPLTDKYYVSEDELHKLK